MHCCVVVGHPYSKLVYVIIDEIDDFYFYDKRRTITSFNQQQIKLDRVAAILTSTSISKRREEKARTDIIGKMYLIL